ncbi:MAG: iron ABC transporter permease, partial [Candidatus Methanomethylophilaceae archaeon]|nr:iron ABC transporter permease [Candidatus Methanomethylophilaceae archaeon]
MDRSGFESMRAEYKRHAARKVAFIAACIVFMAAALAVSVTIGGFEISAVDVYKTIYNHITGAVPEPQSADYYSDYIIWDVRLPRVFFAIVAGVGLAVSGVAMQSLMKNPLAEPYTTGVSSGAYLGVSLAMAAGFTLASEAVGMAGNAFVFAMIPVALMILFSSRLGDSVATIILIGTALSYMFNAFSMLILISSDAETIADVYKWQVGTINSIGWDSLTMVAAVTAVCSVAIGLLSKKLNIMAMGENNAKSLGLNVRRIRIICLTVMALMVAFIISYSGIIGFVGLICPHMIRLVIGSDNRFVIPAAAAFGAAFLLFADTAAKYLSSLDTIPVGV